jgi:hypothetical protein
LEQERLEVVWEMDGIIVGGMVRVGLSHGVSDLHPHSVSASTTGEALGILPEVSARLASAATALQFAASACEARRLMAFDAQALPQGLKPVQCTLLG